MAGSVNRRTILRFATICALATIVLLPVAPLSKPLADTQGQGPVRASNGAASSVESPSMRPIAPSGHGSTIPISGHLSSGSGTLAPRGPLPQSASRINPLIGYSHEPAPTGIADFGVTGVGAGSTAYAYATSSFESKALVRSMSVSVAVTAFELNAMLVLRWGGSNYSYWIQNGLHVAAASRQYTIGGAYVWNFSAPGARLGPSELRGANGSVLATDTYYYIPGCNGLPGQCTTLSWPTTLVARINASSTGGIPIVAYQYNIGSGWVTYDQVSFLHLTGAAVVGFLVDGYAPTPYSTGIFYDAEWDWVGAGGGTTMVDEGSDLSMALGFWNGHHYQAIPSAWNFGGNSGETSSNVTEALAVANPGGAPLAHLLPGAGVLGVLYNQSECGFLNITSPSVPIGTLKVGGVPLVFEGGAANLTLAGGGYAVSLQNYSNASQSVTVSPGHTTRLDLSGAGRTIFTASGLPPGRLWGLTIDGFTRSTTGTAIEFTLPNGTYPVGYLAVGGYVRNSSAPASITIPAPSHIVLEWMPYVYQVPVTESGLPAGTPWWVIASGTLLRGSTATLTVSTPNGSIPFTVGSGYEFIPVPPNGIITVTNGVFTPVVVQFSYRLAFIAGTIRPSTAQLTMNGALQDATGGIFNLSVLPGTYTLVASATGYSPMTVQAVATAGNVTAEPIVLSQLPASNPVGGSSSEGQVSPLALVGLGVALVAVAVVVTIVLLRRQRMAP
jgi:hypothetical protein